MTEATATTVKPSLGDDAEYVMPTSGKHRPAKIVETWGARPDGMVNLQVFTDGTNDGFHSQQGTLWATSIHFDQVEKKQGTWHYPEGSQKALECSGVSIAPTPPEPTNFVSLASPGPAINGGPTTVGRDLSPDTAGDEGEKAPVAHGMPPRKTRG